MLSASSPVVWARARSRARRVTSRWSLTPTTWHSSSRRRPKPCWLRASEPVLRCVSGRFLLRGNAVSALDDEHLSLTTRGLNNDGQSRRAVVIREAGTAANAASRCRWLARRQYAELVALGVGQDRPGDLVALADVRRSGARIAQPRYLNGGIVTTVGGHVGMHPVLDHLLVGHPPELQVGSSAFGR